ncbi:hypothetical protein [Pelagovum pacificum]|nr:hypothetical protein [Pelagovum pacificum]
MRKLVKWFALYKLAQQVLRHRRQPADRVEPRPARPAEPHY